MWKLLFLIHDTERYYWKPIFFSYIICSYIAKIKETKHLEPENWLRTKSVLFPKDSIAWNFCQRQCQKPWKQFINISISIILISSTEHQHSRNESGWISKIHSKEKHGSHSKFLWYVPHLATSLFPMCLSRKRCILQHAPKVSKFELFWSMREQKSPCLSLLCHGQV